MLNTQKDFVPSGLHRGLHKTLGITQNFIDGQPFNVFQNICLQIVTKGLCPNPTVKVNLQRRRTNTLTNRPKCCLNGPSYLYISANVMQQDRHLVDSGLSDNQKPEFVCSPPFQSGRYPLRLQSHAAGTSGLAVHPGVKLARRVSVFRRGLLFGR